MGEENKDFEKTISASGLDSLDAAAENFKAGNVSAPIDLDKHGEQDDRIMVPLEELRECEERLRNLNHLFVTQEALLQEAEKRRDRYSECYRLARRTNDRFAELFTIRKQLDMDHGKMVAGPAQCPRCHKPIHTLWELCDHFACFDGGAGEAESKTELAAICPSCNGIMRTQQDVQDHSWCIQAGDKCP